jgi:hypothetical protein
MSTIDFVLTEFNSIITANKGVLNVEATSDISGNATAIYYVPLSQMKSVFQFQTDASDVDQFSAGIVQPDASSSIQYYTFDKQFVQANPADASMNNTGSAGAILSTSAAGVAYTSQEMTVADDYVRYLARELFNTAYAVDIFNNASEVANSVVVQGMTKTWSDISGILQKCGTSYANSSPNAITAGIDASLNYFTTESNKTNANICRELFMQLANKAPTRFVATAEPTAGRIRQVDTMQPLPFIAGDTIKYTLEIKSATNQGKIISNTTVDPPARTYIIKMVMV